MKCSHCGDNPSIDGLKVCKACAVPCPQCGTPADSAAVGGLCPNCLPADNTLAVEEPPYYGD